MYRNIITCCLKKKGETNPHCIQSHDIPLPAYAAYSGIATPNSGSSNECHMGHMGLACIWKLVNFIPIPNRGKYHLLACERP